MTLAEEYAARFSALAYKEGSAEETLSFYHEMDKACGRGHECADAAADACAAVRNPAFSIFNDAHLAGLWTVPDGSTMKIEKIADSGLRTALVIS